MATAVTTKMNTWRVLDVSGRGFPNGDGPFIAAADNEPERATFGAGELGVSVPTNATDWLVFQGALNKIIRMKSLIFSGLTGGSNTSLPCYLYRRTAANTGGVTTPMTEVSHDSADGAPALQITRYTTNPTGLGAGQVIHAGRLVVANSATNLDRLAFQYSWQNDKALILRDATEFLTVNLGGAVAAGITVDWDALWTEENKI